MYETPVRRAPEFPLLALSLNEKKKRFLQMSKEAYTIYLDLYIHKKKKKKKGFRLLYIMNRY